MGTSVYDLMQPLAPSGLCVNNEFANKLLNLAMNTYMQNVILTVETGAKKKSKHKYNIATMPAIENPNVFNTLKSEIAVYRSQHCGTAFSTFFNVSDNEDILFMDYMLSMCLCYVEIDNVSYNPNVAYSQRVDKFFATRNISIIKALCKIDDKKEQKAKNYLHTLEDEYKNGDLRLLKVNETKNGYTMSQPRATMHIGKNARIMPIFLIQTLSSYIMSQLKQGIMEFTYSKDDKTQRVLNSTLNPLIYIQYYKDQERCKEVFGNVSAKYTRGYIKIPELGLSRYDSTGVRSLNLMRIEKMQRVDEVDKSFIDVDINNIIPSFKEALNMLYANKKIAALYKVIYKTDKDVDNAAAYNDLQAWVDMQYTVGSTGFLRSLHTFMLNNKAYFPKYTGNKESKSSSYLSDGFEDLGV